MSPLVKEGLLDMVVKSYVNMTLLKVMFKGACSDPHPHPPKFFQT